MSKISIGRLAQQLSLKSPAQDGVIKSIFKDMDNFSRLDELMSNPKVIVNSKYTKEDIQSLLNESAERKVLLEERSTEMLTEVGETDFYNEDYIVSMKYNQKAKSCKSRGIPFLLTFAEYKNIIKTKRCKYTNLTLNDTVDDPLQLTIDRIDNSLPYIKGNVVAVCNWVNQFKCNMLENDEAFWKGEPDRMLVDITRMISFMTKKNNK